MILLCVLAYEKPEQRWLHLYDVFSLLRCEAQAN
jgi:hypothetical protein